MYEDRPDSDADRTRTGADELSIDAAFDLLADPTRRTVLQHLATQPRDAVPLDDLVDGLHTRIESDEPDEPPGRLETRLVHVHLPYLDETGLIEYDRADRLVRYRGDEWIERLLAALCEREDTDVNPE